MYSYYIYNLSGLIKTLCLIGSLMWLSNSLSAQFQWEHTGGPEGLGDAISFYNKDFAFLYDNSTLFRTGDGQSWEVVNSTLAGKIVVSDERISIYTEQHMGADQPKQIQFQISKDNGDTWSYTAVPNDAYYNFNQVMLCSHGIYFKAGEKLYRSQTDGQSWKQVSYDSIAFSSLFASDDRVFGRNGDKIFEFNPQSGKWVFSWNVPVSGGILEVVYIRDSNIIIKTGNKFYSSLNKGEDWIIYATQLTQISHFIEKDNNVYFQSGNYIRYTDNGGYSWKNIILNSQYKNMTLIKDKILLISQKDGCFLFDETDKSYLPANKGLHSPGIWKLWAGSNEVWAQLVSDNSLHKYDALSGEWSYSGLPKPPFNSFPFLISPSGFLLYGFDNKGNVIISTNQSTDWDTLNTPFSNSYLENYFWIGDYIYIQDHFSQKYISKDFGVNWNSITRFLTSGVVFKDRIWATEYNGKLIVSLDDANSWEEVENTPEGIHSLYVCEDRLFLIAGLGSQTFLYSSIDGEEWEFSGDGFGINEIRPGYNEVVSIKKFNGIYYLQNERSSLYYSEDNGRSWERILNYNYESMAILNDFVYIGITNGGGVRKSPLPQFGRPFAKGTIFHDTNGNGLKDPDETFMSDVQIMLSTDEYPQKNHFTLSNQDGEFEIRPSYGSNDTLRPNLLSEYVESIEPPFYITKDSIENYDFAVSFHPNVTDGSISGKYNIQPRAGEQLSAHISYQNIGTVPMTGYVGLKLDPEFTFISSSPPPSNIISTDSLVWYFDDLPILGKNQIRVDGSVASDLPDGGLIVLSASINTSVPDISLTDNHIVIQDTLVSVLVPNKKRVFPAEGMTVADMLEGKELEYTILFQNPFDYVVNSVQISDALPAQLDYTSIRIIGSSHDISKWELLPSGILRVFFDDMNLAPKSSDNQNSQGFLSFAIRIRKDNYHHFNFWNTANIIFENNKAITTNHVITRMIPAVILSAEDIGTASLQKLSIFPNPSSQNCYISTHGRMKGKGVVRVFNASGRIISYLEVHDLSREIELKTNQLPDGFYLITAEGAEGMMRGKLILQK